jgi:hypothetical protein
MKGSFKGLFSLCKVKAQSAGDVNRVLPDIENNLITSILVIIN